MTLTIEVNDDNALRRLKEMEENNEIRVVAESALPQAIKMGRTDEERRAIIKSLYGAIPYDEEKYKAQIQFLEEIRNEWER